MQKRQTPPPLARKVDGLKVWVTEDGRVYGQFGEKKQFMSKGSPTVTARTEAGGRTIVTVAKLVATAWVNPHYGRSIYHKDGDPTNNRASNLEWMATRKDTQLRWNCKMALEMAEDPNHRLHGTPTGYNLGCRCRLCKAAEKVEHMKRVTRKTIREAETLCAATAW